MEYSDDEVEDFPEFVSNYCFEDEDQGAVSFSVLPIIWNASENMQNLETQIYIRGTTDDGLQTIFKPVKAWKFDLSGEKPEISVLSKDNWMKLQKPRKVFEAGIRTVLITVSFLHLVKKNPQLNEKVIWHKLSRIFSSYEVRPSEDDLGDCKEIIKEAVKHEELLTKSEYLMTFLGEKPQKRKRADEDALSKEKREFIVDDDDYANDAEDVSDDSCEEEDGEEEPFDSVCCICDNGGTLLCCEGSCMRSFHATEKAAEEADSLCESLGFSEKEVKAMPNFKCNNCLYKLHQCFSCGQLGSSDKATDAEVFQCVNATCGYFYHPHCVAKLLHRDSEVAAKELQDKIFEGESFTCPLHICIQCNKPEDRSVPEMQMAVCRRCPKAYHEKCLPRKIAFEEDEKRGIIERAWRGLLVNRILIYCLKHEIDESLGTPKRNHIKFPDDKKDRQSSAAAKDIVTLKKKKLSLGATDQRGTATQSKKKAVLDSHSDKGTDQKKIKLKGPDSLSCLPTEKKPVLTKVVGSCKTEDNKTSTQQLVPVKPIKSGKVTEGHFTKTSKSSVKMVVPQLDSESEKRILALMEEASSIITLDDVIDNHNKVIPARTYKQKIDRNKTITQGKVDASCEAVRAAIKKMGAGGTIEDAKGICEPKVLHQVAKWKNDLKVYLAPFLCGMRYTSYGRHFTKLDKLKQIVDKIHWYVDNDDMIVDFCCGANDFSWLMKQKLEQTRKNCSFKNYDLFYPKNDFNFEKRDWMSVQRSELPLGKQLIMGLNPPFGVKAALANQFIDKALQFQPKLLILIVPPETKRLDEKKIPYDLIWEDTEKLSGRSFYLPGSVDVNEKQLEDWNVVAPVLYLWSHPDFTDKHRAIAQKHGHLLGGGESPPKSIRSAKKPLQNKRVRGSSFKKKQKVKDVSVVTKVASSSPQLDPSEGRPEETAPGGKTTEDLEARSSLSDHRGEKRPATEDLEAQSSLSDHRGEKRPATEDLEARPSLSDHREGKRPVSETQGNNNKGASSRKRRHSEERHQIRRSVENVPPHKRWQSPPINPDRRSRYLSPPINPDHRPRYPSPYRGARHSPVNSRLSLERERESYSSMHEGPSPSLNVVEMMDPSYERIGPTTASYEASYGREQHNGSQAAYHHPETDAYLSGRERYPPIETHPHPRSSEFPAAYHPREPEVYAFNQPPPALQPQPPEMRYTSTYSMDSTYSRTNYVPATERYNLRLDEQNRGTVGNVGPHMAHTAGVDQYSYQDARLRFPGGPPAGYQLDPYNPYAPYN